ncbi:hypothetical protein BE21_19820 [Sorangium cellulosum]|uniref:Uncharacterized protein n=1 Tax=Sorangium cellulosum TaxID=56 RepID=A0A150TWH9_SORCE|nr:hypothetical protein BE21_19820 [Sorangium cellulosum]
METTLDALGKASDVSSKRVPPDVRVRWDEHPPDDFGEGDVVYLLLTDSYGYDGTNAMHWIVLLDLFESKERPHRLLATYADPLYDELSVWPWDALLAWKVLDGFRVERPAP